MRHHKKGKKLGRKKDSRKALKKNLAQALILNEKIKTTKAKAKFVQPFVEKLISISKDKSLVSKQRIHTLLANKEAEKKLIKEIAPRCLEKKKGGYTRVLKLGKRKGDGAETVLIELVK